LGVYGGDDGITPNPRPTAYVKAAASIGQQIKIDVRMRGDSGVKFLARIYSPQVWYGETNSMCDIRRQLTKFHLTERLRLDLTPTDKLLENCRSWACSDAETPIMGDLVTAVAKIAGPIVPRPTFGLTPYHVVSSVMAAEHYPNRLADWMFEVVEDALPNADIVPLLQAIGNATKLEDFLSLPPIAPRDGCAEPYTSVVVNGELIESSAPAVVNFDSPPPDNLRSPINETNQAKSKRKRTPASRKAQRQRQRERRKKTPGRASPTGSATC